MTADKLLPTRRLACLDYDQPTKATLWPAPTSDHESLAHRLRYDEPTRGDLLHAASVMLAYEKLIKMPQRRAAVVLGKLKRLVEADDGS